MIEEKRESAGEFGKDGVASYGVGKKKRMKQAEGRSSEKEGKGRAGWS